MVWIFAAYAFPFAEGSLKKLFSYPDKKVTKLNK